MRVVEEKERVRVQEDPRIETSFYIHTEFIFHQSLSLSDNSPLSNEPLSDGAGGS